MVHQLLVGMIVSVLVQRGARTSQSKKSNILEWQPNQRPKLDTLAARGRAMRKAKETGTGKKKQCFFARFNFWSPGKAGRSLHHKEQRTGGLPSPSEVSQQFSWQRGEFEEADGAPGQPSFDSRQPAGEISIHVCLCQRTCNDVVDITISHRLVRCELQELQAVLASSRLNF